jgi:hypothetical protein
MHLWYSVAPLETEGQAQHFLSELGIECYNGGSLVRRIIIYHKQQNKMINTKSIWSRT